VWPATADSGIAVRARSVSASKSYPSIAEGSEADSGWTRVSMAIAEF
jgi:hypothetical protein